MNNEIRVKLGALVKVERERRGIVLSELAEQLKISEENLLAIESGDITSLPSELYYGLFAKSYTEAVGIDYSKTVEAIKSDLEEQPAQTETGGSDFNKKKKKTEFKLDDKDDTSGKEMLKKLLYVIGAIAGLFAIFLVVYLLFLKEDTMPGTETTSSSEESATESLTTGTDRQTDYANYDWSTVSYPSREKLTLTLRPNAESWSTILADGDTVIYRTLYPGREYNVEAEHRMLVSIGIPSAVETILNGQEVNLRDPETRRISRVEINQINYKQILNPEQPPPSEESENPSSPPVTPPEQKSGNESRQTGNPGETVQAKGVGDES